MSRKLFICLMVVLVFATATIYASAEDAVPHNGYLVRLNGDEPLAHILSDDMQRVSGLEHLYWVESEEEAQVFLDMGLATYVEPNIILEPLEEDVSINDPYYPSQWGLSTIDFPTYYETGFSGDGITVAVIDSGLYVEHEDFLDTKISVYSKNFLGDGSDTAAALYYRDQSGHGTFVASQIAPVTNNGIGIAGVASDVELMVLRCVSKSGSKTFAYDYDYDSNSGSVAVVSQAIQYATDNGAQIINLSLGTTTYSQTLVEAVTYAQNQGVIVVAAVGNGYGSAFYYPAALEGVIGVGSVSQSGDTLVKSNFSQYNTSVDVTAPGGDVLGIYIDPTTDTISTDGYATGDGTSYAAPVVAALAAAAKEKFPELTTSCFLSLLTVTATDYGAVGYDTSFGYGVINAGAVLASIDECYGITYVLNDQEDATLPEDAPMAYTIQQEVVLPTPTREGYYFDGWYRDASFAGDAVVIQPIGTLGSPVSVVADGVHTAYAIENVTYYAKWVPLSLTTPLGVTIFDMNAVQSGNTYTVVLPKDADPVSASSIVVAVLDGSDVTVPTTDDNGTTWHFSVGAGSVVVEYTLVVSYSDYMVPILQTDASQTGVASLPSLDGQMEVKPYVMDVSNWFNHATTYTTTCDGVGEVRVLDGQLTYTPQGTEQVGTEITITVQGANPDFQSADVVTLVITLDRPDSSSTLSVTDYAYDIYTEEDLSVVVQLYSNTFVQLSCDDIPLTESDYTMTITDDDAGDFSDQISIIFHSAWLQNLTLDAHSLTFQFSSGADATLTLVVEDSAPCYQVTFYLAEGDESYATWDGIRTGSALGSLPQEPTKSGYTFLGWYLADGTTRITTTTIVETDLAVYANWSATSSESSGGSGGGGSSSGTTDSDGETETDSDTTEDISDPLLDQPALDFDDVTATDWFYEDVAFVVDQNLMNGIDATTFAPDSTTTRGMIVTILYRMEQEPEVATDCPFVDVETGSYYETAVIWSQENGIVNGYEPDRFAPDDAITREQLATILYRYAQYKGYDTSELGDVSHFEDAASISDYASTPVPWAYGTGLLTGKSAEKLEPAETALRCEVAAILHRFSENYRLYP